MKSNKPSWILMEVTGFKIRKRTFTCNTNSFSVFRREIRNLQDFCLKSHSSEKKCTLHVERTPGLTLIIT